MNEASFDLITSKYSGLELKRALNSWARDSELNPQTHIKIAKYHRVLESRNLHKLGVILAGNESKKAKELFRAYGLRSQESAAIAISEMDNFRIFDLINDVDVLLKAGKKVFTNTVSRANSNEFESLIKSSDPKIQQWTVEAIDPGDSSKLNLCVKANLGAISRKCAKITTEYIAKRKKFKKFDKTPITIEEIRDQFISPNDLFPKK